MRTLIIEADGASRGNPGEASYGAVVRDADTGELLAELAEYLGRATNNVAEYRGVIAGLEAAGQIDPDARVDVRLDSKLVVEQLSGRWQVKHPDMKPLAARARSLFPASGAVTFTWVPRSRNKHADRLANEALDAAAKGKTWTSKTPVPGRSREPSNRPPGKGHAGGEDLADGDAGGGGGSRAGVVNGGAGGERLAGGGAGGDAGGEHRAGGADRGGALGGGADGGTPVTRRGHAPGESAGRVAGSGAAVERPASSEHVRGGAGGEYLADGSADRGGALGGGADGATPATGRAQALGESAGRVAGSGAPVERAAGSEHVRGEAGGEPTRGGSTGTSLQGTGAASSDAARSGAASLGASARDSGAATATPTSTAPRLGWSADVGTPTRLLLLRHGVTPLTGEKRFSGRIDPSLTPDGLAQARAAALRLAGTDVGDAVFGRIDAIVASPLTRTQQTAAAVASLAGLPVRTEPGFREMDFGDFEGLTFAEARSRYPAELSAFLSSVDAAAPGGESVSSAAARAAVARDRTIARFPRKTVLIVTHVTPIKTLLCQALGAPLSAVHRMELSAASLTVVDFYGDGILNVRCVNDTAHLRAVARPGADADADASIRAR